MHPDELTDGRLDEALRSQPRWQPPPHFARAVMARLPNVVEPEALTEPSRLPGIVHAALTGLTGAALAYLAGMTLLVATPVLVANAALVAWISAAAGLLVVAAFNGLVEEWI